MAQSGPQEVSVEKLQARIKGLEEENRKWMRLAGTNRLTNLPNSLMFLQVVLPQELRNAVGTPVALACILICPDGLGEINENHGRSVGDMLIAQISSFLKQQIGVDERLYHLDGANFAILMLGTGVTEGRARRKATDIRTSFREHTFTVADKEVDALTCSAGVATVEGVILEADVAARVAQLYQELCDRLYKAKQRGGNLVVGSVKRDA